MPPSVERGSRVTLGIAAVAMFTLMAPARAQERVFFPSPDSGVVAASLYGDGPRAVVLVPGGRYDKTSWEPQARMIAEAGFRVLAIDLRGRGQSRGGRGGADAVHFDVLGAVRYLRTIGAGSITVVGASYGGWAAARAATMSAPGEIDRIVLLAHSPIDHPERLSGRKLFIVSRGDTTGAGTRRLTVIRAQYERAPNPKELLVLDGSAHAQHLFQTDQADELLREILRFVSAP